jgi:hypothetical protein
MFVSLRLPRPSYSESAWSQSAWISVTCCLGYYRPPFLLLSLFRIMLNPRTTQDVHLIFTFGGEYLPGHYLRKITSLDASSTILTWRSLLCLPVQRSVYFGSLSTRSPILPIVFAYILQLICMQYHQLLRVLFKKNTNWRYSIKTMTFRISMTE